MFGEESISLDDIVEKSKKMLDEDSRKLMELLKNQIAPELKAINDFLVKETILGDLIVYYRKTPEKYLIICLGAPEYKFSKVLTLRYSKNLSEAEYTYISNIMNNILKRYKLKRVEVQNIKDLGIIEIYKNRK